MKKKVADTVCFHHFVDIKGTCFKSTVGKYILTIIITCFYWENIQIQKKISNILLCKILVSSENSLEKYVLKSEISIGQTCIIKPHSRDFFITRCTVTPRIWTGKDAGNNLSGFEISQHFPTVRRHSLPFVTLAVCENERLPWAWEMCKTRECTAFQKSWERKVWCLKLQRCEGETFLFLLNAKHYLITGIAG